ncbi:hypothetical protein PHSY_006787 [Pseudozyma hubeiensis SY62]|uniref:VASt domain-containing protein n=1 Tax=Pseudozyma hubeiensis (strain SY62) TaxID=1305764 RepID=R9PD54_PSEHS|nr:hypothetical protein PHSY_006787 [Pseudozyma hubeiensis SY62]GAC99187.1 hypothetical protein PHSY_006787 [Pseudozyma hubeiensis SY62]
MSSFKNIFRNSNKDKVKDSLNHSSSASSSDHKRAKSLSTLASSQSDHLTADDTYSVGTAFPSKNGSIPVSPFTVPVNLPAIDVTDLSSLEQPNRSPAESNVSTLKTTQPSSVSNNSLRWDPKTESANAAAASQSSRSMARPSSANHSQARSEPTNAMAASGGKSSRRSSKVDKSDDGHAKPEPLNRHELMRRAMATAQEYGEHDGDDSGSVFEDDHMSNSHHSHNYHPNTNPANSTPITARHVPLDRPGDGSLSMDAFGNGHPNLVSASNGSAPASAKRFSGPSSASPLLTASATMPTLVTPAPIRAEMPRSDSLEEIVDQGYDPMQRSEPFDPSKGPPQRASTLMEPSTSPNRASLQGMAKSSSSSALLRPTDLPAPSDGSPRRPSDAGSINGAFSRLRKNSDSSTMSKASRVKKPGPSAGIAGALAASGIAGMGVGHAAALQQSQSALIDLDKKRKDSKDTGVFQGGMYRDPSTGSVVERDQDGNPLHPLRPHQERRDSSFVSHDGSVFSDRSSVSGLGAAAGFGAASAALLSSIGGVPGMPVTPLLAPDGPNPTGAGGLHPPAAGGANVGGQHIDGETTWPEDMGPQITGFAVASSKRNHEFHQLFPQVPEDDYLIEDYGCAVVREILIQGRLYISENHLCFKANIFGWVTNVVLPFSEIISIEKRMTAFVIPNAIQIATLHAKHNFTSFLSRDATYDLVVNIWKLSHPGVPLAAADQADLSDEYSEIEEDGDSSAAAAGAGGDSKGGDSEHQGKAAGESKQSKRARLKRKLKGTKTGVRDENLAAVAAAAARSGTPLIPQSRSPAPTGKRAAHRKTTCPCEEKKEHFSSVVLDTTYPAVPEKIYNLLFTSTFMKEFWTDDQKLMDLQISEWSPNAENRNLLSRNISYIKPLAGGFGPKQTKCMLTDENLHVDFDNYVVTLTTTRTPDVPSGGSFSVKTKTCITWSGTGNVSHVYVTCQVEWTGRSMLKSIIDKASLDGQKQYYKELDEAVRKYLTDHTSEFKEEGDDAAAVEEIARAATPGPNNRKGGGGAGDAGGASTEGAGGNSSGSNGGSSASGGASGGVLGSITAPIMDAFGMVGDLLGGALEMVGIEGGDSLKSLGFGLLIFVLLISNIYTWRRSSSSVASSANMVQHLDRMQAGGHNRGYFSDQGYYGPVSPRHHSGDRQPVYERVFAPNVYITPPGGNDATPDAIAKTVAEVLERLYQQNVDRFKPTMDADGDDPESVKRLVAEAEAVFERLEKRLKAVNQGVKAEKAGKVEL